MAFSSQFVTFGEKSALAGTTGTPGSGNKFVTDSDARNSNARTPSSGSVSPAKLTPIASGFVVPFLWVIDATAGTPGSADDVDLGVAPVALKVVDAYWQTDTGIALATVQVRTATGGAGTALTTALAAAVSLVRVREVGESVSGTSNNLAASAHAYLRRSDQGVSGTIVLTCVPT